MKLFTFAVFVALSAAAGYAQTGEEAGQDVSVHLFATGVSRYSPGKWGVVGVRGVNPGNTDVSATVSVFLENDTRTQYTRRLWLPAAAIRRTWLPLRIPAALPPDAQAVNASAVVVLNTKDGQVIKRGSDVTLVTQFLLPLNVSSIQTGTIYRQPRLDAPPNLEDIDQDWDAYEMLVMTREATQDDRTTIDLAEAFFPPYIEAYHGLDQLLICSDRWLDDSAGSTALRGWVAQGGRVWVMLDRASMATLHALLGNATCCQVVDRVELTEFELETAEQSLVNADPFERWESERPVDFVRVLVTDAAQIHTRLDGWPAAFSMPLGAGEVLVTTLGPRGWRYEFQRFADPQPAGLPTSGPTRALRHLAGRFQVARPVSPVEQQGIRPLLQSQIGYQIPSRKLTGLILGGNCVVLFLVGVLLARWQKLEHLSWVLPVTALTTTGLMIAVARTNNVGVPAIASGFQLVDVLPATNEAHAKTLATLFSPDSTDLPLATTSFSAAVPELSDLEGTVKQVVWGDNGQAEWRNIGVASGSARLVEVDDHYALAERLSARGRFGPQGFEGRLQGVSAAGQTADAIIAFPPSPSAAVEFAADHQFLCREGRELAPHEYLTGVLLSDEQQRRQVFYRQLLKQSNDRLYPGVLTLFFWSDGWQIGASVPEAFQTRGSTLWAVPVDIERTPSGAAFVIPSTFITMRNAGGRFGGSGAYNPRTGEWTRDVNMATDSMFRFVLPRQVLPCQVGRATVTLKVHAPSREVKLQGVAAGSKTTIETLNSPSGVLQFVVEDPALLKVDEHGGLLFGVAVGSNQRATAGDSATSYPRDANFDNSTWQIDYLRVSVAGQVE